MKNTCLIFSSVSNKVYNKKNCKGSNKIKIMKNFSMINLKKANNKCLISKLMNYL